jgi:FkbM family methyltransferase
MKRSIQKVLEVFGCEIRRKNASLDAFAVQKVLTLTQNPIIFDVGAHIGMSVVLYHDLFPTAQIYAFEPSPSSFEQLKQRASALGSHANYQLAISDREEKLAFNVNSFSETNSLLVTDERSTNYWSKGVFETKETIEVPCTTIDSFCAQNKISTIDILKIDVQGAEFSVLQGAEKMLATQAISLLYFEVVTAPIYKEQRKLHEYFELLDSFGYELYGLYYPVKNSRQLVQADFIFLRSAS